jgi:DNA-binding NtrC family response regulator
MGPAQSKRQTVLLVEDDGELRRLMVTLLEDEQLDAIECESAEAALAIMLMGDRHITMLLADIRLPGVMDGIDLAWEVKLRWPLLPVVLTSGLPRECVRPLPPGIAYMAKPFQPLDVLVIAEQALASSQRGERVPTSLVYQQRQPRAPVAHATEERRSAS